MRLLIATSLLVLLTLSACSKKETTERISNARETVADKLDDIAVPWRGTREDPKAREAERFDEKWRDLSSFRAQQQRAQQQQQQQAAIANLRFVPSGKETLKGLSLAAINTAPIAVPIQGDLSGPSVLKTQVYLDRLRFSVGALDGRWGKNSAISLWWFQRSRGLDSTGAVDEPTFRALAAAAAGEAAVRGHTLTADDVKGPFESMPEDVYDKAKLACLCYESLSEKLAEQFHTTVELLETLNPNVKLADLAEGAAITVPNVRAEVSQDSPDIAKVVISVAGSTLNAFDASGNLVFHAPTTLGSKYDPSPNETVSVKKVAFDPNFHYQPKLFAEVPDDEPEANLNPGPNSPVGVVWIALSKPHFGIHGTADPDSIGYASSHGCVRLTNWDAREVAHRISPNVPVEFVDTRAKS
ncbi:MAG: murein L,D-transpeptidase [Thermoanaerobaculia bacterium]|nr:murein L,D-transpeptidase [Thermoanaerobaculia bacterium]